MIISPISGLTFDGSYLKKLYKKGKIKIKYGLYGEELTKKNVTDEHLLCRCFGGKNDLSNIALATKEANWRRGNDPIENHLTYAMLKQYCEQFKGIKLPKFNGDEYIKGIKKTITELINAETD